MARSARAAQAFLDEVLNAVTGRERQELDELRDAKARDLKLPLEQTTLQRWDVGLLPGEACGASAMRVDQEAFRKHFPPQESLALRDAGDREDARRALRARAGRQAVASRCAGLRGARRTHRPADGGAVRRPVSARRQVQPRRGVELPQWLAAAEARRRRPRWWSTSTARPDARRPRDAAARVRPRRAQQPVGHAPRRRRPAPACCATSSRRRRRCWRTGSTTRACWR